MKSSLCLHFLSLYCRSLKFILQVIISTENTNLRNNLRGVFAMIGGCIHFPNYTAWEGQPDKLKGKHYFGMSFYHFVNTFGITKEDVENREGMSNKIMTFFERMLDGMSLNLRPRVLAAASAKFLPEEATIIPALVVVSYSLTVRIKILKLLS
jgi:hypothetical protein